MNDIIKNIYYKTNGTCRLNPMSMNLLLNIVLLSISLIYFRGFKSPGY